MQVTVSSPTRVDFAGGTLDCWPLYNFVGDCCTINLSINIMTHVDLVKHETQDIHVHMQDLSYKKYFQNFAELMVCEDKELHLLKCHLNYWKPSYGFKIHCSSESPVGGGLGGSSSLSISLIKAFAKVANIQMSTIEMVTLASNVEANLLNTPTGTQDYFPAIQGGLHLIQYGPEGPSEELLDFPEELFQKKMFLVYTGRPHHSGLNNWEVIKAAVAKDPVTMESLKEIRRVAREMEEACKQQNWEALKPLFKEEFNARVKLSEGFNSPEIEKLRDIMETAGAEAVKICGAGGGGCVMVWAPQGQRDALMDLCTQNGFQVFDVQPVRNA